MTLTLALAAAAAAVLAVPAPLDPSPPICTTNVQDCQPGQVIYCPDTGGFITRFSGSCPSLWVGPYRPGNPSNGGDDR